MARKTGVSAHCGPVTSTWCHPRATYANYVWLDEETAGRDCSRLPPPSPAPLRGAGEGGGGRDAGGRGGAIGRETQTPA